MRHAPKWKRQAAIILNAAIIVTALALSGILIRKYLIAKPVTLAAPNIMVGQQFSLQDVNWQKGKKTLLLFLYLECQYCISSIEFYQRLIKETNNRDDIKLVAVFQPQDAPSKELI